MDTLIRKIQVSTNTTYGIIQSNNFYYNTIFIKENNNGGSSSLRHNNTDWAFIFNKYDNSLNKSINIMVGAYSEQSGWSQDHGSWSGTSGIFKPFSSLIVAFISSLRDSDKD